MDSEARIYTTAGDTVFVEHGPQGLGILLLPKEPPLEEDVLDVFQLGLKHTSVVKALDRLRAGQTYTSADGRCRIVPSPSGMVLDFPYPHRDDVRFQATLAPPNAQRLLQEIERTVTGDVPWPPSETVASAATKVGRNDPCPCGSGRKFKKCCLPRPGGPVSLPEELKRFAEHQDHVVLGCLEAARHSPGCMEGVPFWLELGVWDTGSH